jgi:hypothetical protein
LEVGSRQIIKANSGIITDFFLLMTNSMKTIPLRINSMGNARPKYAKGQKTAGLTNVERNESTSAIAKMLPE